VVVDAGVTVIGLVVAPVDHVYDATPLAVSVAGEPAQTDAGLTVTTGAGFTVIVNVCVVGMQPLGVTVTVVVIGDAPLLIAVNEGTLPVPLAARPMLVLLLVHVNVVPTGAPPNTTDDTV
jgi:hypothetical protein